MAARPRRKSLKLRAQGGGGERESEKVAQQRRAVRGWRVIIRPLGVAAG